MKLLYALFMIMTLMLLVNSSVSAQDMASDPVPVYMVGDVTVTAPPIIEGNDINSYGERVTVVSSDQVDDLNAQDLPSALRRVPGVTISRYNMVGSYGGGEGGTVYIRGHGSGRPGADIATMVDGIPRFVGVWTHPLMDMMSLDIADHISIHKSAQPVMQGTMAFGTVNIHTKRMEREGYTGRVQTSIGSHATIVERLEHGGMINGFDYYITGSHRRSDGHRERADGSVQSLYGRIGYRFGRSYDLTFQINHTDSRANDPGRTGVPRTDLTEQYTTDNELYIGSFSHTNGIFDGVTKVYYEDGAIDWRQWDSKVIEQFNSITDYDNYGIRIRETARFLNGEVVYGLDHDLYGGSFIEERDSGDVGMKKILFRNTAPYVMISGRFGEETVVIPSVGARYTLSRYFGNHFGAQAGIKVARGRSEWYANAARAFNLPGVYTAVQYDTYWSSVVDNNGNWKDLNPEMMYHYETGIAHIFTDSIRADISFYYDSVTDGLRFVSPPPSPPRYANIGEYISRGIEGSISLVPLRQIDLFLGGTVSSTTPGNVPNTPDLTVSFGATYTAFNKLRFTLDTEYIDDQYVLNPRFAASQVRMDGYSLVNLRTGYLVRIGEYLGELFAAVENLTAETYEYRPGYVMPGRTVTVGLDVRI
jgi:outer membrane cobalamin receptor